jgi:rRNA processing protein Krr1/Pno1
MHVNPEKIRYVIGPGGRTIRSIMEETRVTIDVENDGTVVIGSASEDAAAKATRMIEALTREVKVGEIYTGKWRESRRRVFVESARAGRAGASPRPRRLSGESREDVCALAMISLSWSSKSTGRVASTRRAARRYQESCRRQRSWPALGKRTGRLAEWAALADRRAEAMDLAAEASSVRGPKGPLLARANGEAWAIPGSS